MSTEKTRVLNEQQIIMLAAGIGTWRYEAARDRFRGDGLVCDFLGLDPEIEAFTLKEALANVQPKSRASLSAFLTRGDEPAGTTSIGFDVAPSDRPARRMLARAHFLPYQEGTGGRLVGIMLDSTENESLQDNLRRSEERFRMLANGVPNAFVFFDQELYCQFANEEFAARVGKQVGEIIGRHASNVFGAEEYPKHAAHLQAALEGESIVYETIGIERDGQRPYLRIAHKPAFDAQGRIKGIFREATDITELKRLEQQVRESEAQFKGLASGVPNSFIYLDKDLRVEFANETFLKGAGRSAEQTRGRHIADIIGAKLYATQKGFFERALRGETVSYEATGRVGDGSGFYRFQYQPSFDGAGQVQGLFCVATDITDRRLIELELEGKQRELVRSNKDLEQFAYVASHDLKAPLRAIEVLVEWLREDLAGYEGGDVQSNLGLLEKRTRRLGRLLDDLLAYSRVGRKVGDYCEVDCDELVRDVIQLLAARPGMSVEVHGKLPTFTTYPTPLEQVFRNLIGNALKHHPGPTGKVTVACEEHPGHYLFSVQDDGEGIPAQYAERVFQMFQTLKPRDEVEGSGMGLAIVNRIVEWQGGRVWFEPAPAGSGTVFKFEWQKNGHAGAPAVEERLPEEETTCRRAAS